MLGLKKPLVSPYAPSCQALATWMLFGRSSQNSEPYLTFYIDLMLKAREKFVEGVALLAEQDWINKKVALLLTNL